MCRLGCKLPVVLLAFLASVVLLCAQDGPEASLGSTNQDQIQHFWRAVQASNGPVTVVAFGDSVSDDYLSIQKQLFWRLQDHFGSSGLAFGAAYYAELGGGAGWTQPNSNWWAAHLSLSGGGHALTYPRPCDHVGLFWVAQPAGGDFTLSVFSEGQTNAALVLPVCGYAPSPVGCYTNVPVARGAYRLRVDGLNGTNTVLGVQMLDAAANGIAVAFMSQDGQALGAILDISSNILRPVVSSLNPQLVVWHMKEAGDLDGALVLSNRLLQLEFLWQATLTNGDVVYLGTPHDSTDGAPVQNPVVRYAAVRDHRAYMDCMTPCISFAQMNASFLLRDQTHPSELCNAFLANTVVWPQLGLGRLEKRQPFTPAPLPANPVWLTNVSSALPVYGWACTTPEESSLVLYNPTSATGSALVDCQSAFGLPAGSSAIYDVRPAYSSSRLPVSGLYTGQPALVTLTPSETVALEVHPRATYAAQILAAGPLAYWRLGESNGSVAADVVGANPGQYLQATQHVLPGALTQQDDGAVQLNGAGSHVFIPNGAPFNFSGTNSFTLSAWVKAAGLGGVQRFFSNHDPARGSGYALGISGAGNLVFTAFGVGEFTATNTPAAPGQWGHAVLVRRTNTVESYWNGVCVGVAPLGPLLSSAANLQLGGNPAPAPVEEPFSGQLDEVAIFGSALTAAQIQALYQSQSLPVYPPVFMTQPAGQSRFAGCEACFSAQAFGTPPFAFQWLQEGQSLPDQTNANLLLTQLTTAMAGNYTLVISNAAGAVTSAPAALTVLAPPAYVAGLAAAQPAAYWRLDETMGPTVWDSWGTNHGIAAGNVQLAQFGALPYTHQNCAGFDGTAGTQVDIPYSPDLNPPTFSIEFWAQPAGPANGAQSPLASRDTAPPSGYCFEITSDQRWAFLLGGGAFGWQTNLGAAIVPGKWTFLTGTFDGTNQGFYIDGQLVAQTPAALLANTRRPLRLGAGATESPGGEYFAGKLDEVVLFPYALSSDAVHQHYQAAFQSPPATRLSIDLMGANLLLSWPTGQLEHAESLTGPWKPLPGAVSPWLLTPTGACNYFRLAPD